MPGLLVKFYEEVFGWASRFNEDSGIWRIPRGT
jgi:hypothetical protein